MKFSKILSTTIAIGALGFATISSASLLSLTYTSGASSVTLVDDISGIDTLAFNIDSNGQSDQINTTTNINDWGFTSIATRVSDDPLMSLATSISNTGSAELTVVATAMGLTDFGTLSNFYSDNNTIGSMSSEVELYINGAWQVPQLSSFDGSISIASSLNIYGVQSVESEFGLRITQVFTSNATVGGLTTVTVPEPSIIALLGLGLVGMGVATRRKQKAA